MTQTIGEVIESANYPNLQGKIDSKKLPVESRCNSDCEICGGIGFINYDVPVGHFLFGKVDPCPNITRSKLMELGNYGLRYDEQNELKWSSVMPYNNSLAVAEKIRIELEKQPGAWIFLYGKYGIAKSLILKIAVAEMLRSVRHSHYINMVDLLDDIRLSFSEEDVARSLNERIQKWSKIPFLAIDEFEKTNPTPWVMERMFQVFDRRYNLAIHGEAATLIASNQAPMKFPPEFSSRLSDGRGLVLELKGADIRPAMTREDKF